MSSNQQPASLKEQIKAKCRFGKLFQELYPDHFNEAGNSRCPNDSGHSNADESPSFQLGPEHGYCHAGCKPPGKVKAWDVFSLWQFNKGCDFKAAVRDLAAKCGIVLKTRKRGPVVTTYDYVGEDGEMLFQVCRHDPKDFTQRKPDPDRPGEWLWSLGGTRRVLFNLPKVITSKEILLVEGEKDALNLSRLGLTATTPPQGGTKAGNKWSTLCEKYGIHKPLKGKTVYVIPDHDQAGRNHACSIASSLHGLAKTVKLLDLKEIWPDLPEKGDVSDLVAKYGEDEAKRLLLELAEKTAEYEPSSEAQNEATDEATTSRPSKFKILMTLIEAQEIRFFHDQFQAPWACIKIKNHHENIRIRSGLFKSHLTRLFYQATGDGCGREIIQQAQDLCSSKALFDGTCQPLSYRAAWQDGHILIDLGNPDWTCAEISATGWRIINPTSPPFRRFTHMKPLPEPVPGGRVQEILSVLPIKDRASQDLYCVWLPSGFVPDVPRASILLHGLQGSGKTFVSECSRGLVDPSVTVSLSLPKDATELVQALDHHYLPVFDNLSGLPKWASDVLCRATTGLGHTKRQLYSDDDDFPYFLQRSYILNGISVCTNQPDLLDRVLIIELARISDTERKSTRTLMAQFNALRGRVFHAMLDALSHALRVHGSTQIDKLPRLADWAEWALPLAEAVGVGEQAFLSALRQSIATQHREINENDPTAVALFTFMTDKPCLSAWSGTSSELYEELAKIADELKLDRERSWPKAPNALSRRIRQISHNLAAGGLEVTDTRDSTRKRTRLISIKKAERFPEKLSEVSDRPITKDNNQLSGTVSRTVSDEDHDSVHNTEAHNDQESFAFGRLDDEDDISGTFAGGYLENPEEIAEDIPF